LTIWRMHIRPDSHKNSNPTRICVENGYVGIGWRVDETPIDKDDYFKKGEEKYGDPSWRSASNLLINSMQVGDLVWLRDLDGTYFLGQITGDWKYIDDVQARDADLLNIRPAEIYKVGRTVPGKLKNSFIPSRVIQRVSNSTVAKFSRLIFNSLSGQSAFSVSMFDSHDILDLLDHVELEDLVGLYLQTKFGYVMTPSSRSRRNDTIAYEYELVSTANGERLYVQVKSENKKLDPEMYAHMDGNWVLYNPTGYKSKPVAKNVKLIENEELLKFMQTHKKMLPISITAWMDIVK
jgi:hypothetical protein